MSDLVQRAKKLAHISHAGQVDKAGRPYIDHVARVAAAVSDDPEAEAVAWLHDVLEDASPDFCRELIDQFSGRVMMAVVDLTRHESSQTGWYYAAIAANPLALRVKLADIADNSDEARLALLDDKTAARLRRKYARAIEALAGDADE